MNNLPRYERLLNAFLSGRKRERPDNDVKEVKKDESKHSNHVKRVRGLLE
jgi:hypothetical protein